METSMHHRPTWVCSEYLKRMVVTLIHAPLLTCIVVFRCAWRRLEKHTISPRKSFQAKSSFNHTTQYNHTISWRTPIPMKGNLLDWNPYQTSSPFILRYSKLLFSSSFKLRQLIFWWQCLGFSSFFFFVQSVSVSSIVSLDELLYLVSYLLYLNPIKLYHD